MSVKTKSFFDTLFLSNLLSTEQFASAYEFGEGGGSAQAVVRELIERGWLTRWQGQQLLAGRNKFFLGKYKLLDALGQGGMGAVFKAEQALLERVVAVKVLNKQLSQNSHALSRFLREIRLVATLNHPNIVTAYDADCVGDTYFLAMEYVEGRTLRQWMQEQRPLPTAWSCECVRQVALGLQHAHEQGLVHRDIKPSNILVIAGSTQDSPVAKLLDLGLSRLAGEGSGQSVDELTQTGQIIGSPDYMSPEQAVSARSVDIRGDIYSLGCTLFDLVSGRLPFEGDSIVAKLMARVRGDAPRIRTINRELPQELDDVVARMLERDPTKRFQTPNEVAAALAQVIANAKSSDAPAVAEPPARRSAVLPIPAAREPDRPAAPTLARAMPLPDADLLEPSPPPRPAAATPGRPAAPVLRTPTPVAVPQPTAAIPPPPVSSRQLPAASAPPAVAPAPPSVPSPAVPVPVAVPVAVPIARLVSPLVKPADPMAGIMSELTNFASDGKGRKRRGGRAGGRRRRRSVALWNTLIFGGILLLAGGGMWLVEQRRAADRAKQQAARAAGVAPKEQVDPLKSDPNWLVAKWIVETGGWVTVEIDGGRKVVKQSRFIPKKSFQILEIDLESINWSTAEPLSLLPDLPALTVIEANSSAFSDVDLKQLAGAARLTTLKLARTRVTSFGLAPLAKLPQLVNLDLERTSVSDDGVDALAKCKRLTTLVVRGTSLTEQGIAALKSALPDCRIVTE